MTRDEILTEVDCVLSEAIPHHSLFAWNRFVATTGLGEEWIWLVAEYNDGINHACAEVEIQASMVNDLRLLSRTLHYQVQEMERLLNRRVFN